MSEPIRFFEPPRRILLACPQRIGDVLLATPLARSLKRAWPEARLDMLVLRGTAGALEGNPDVAEIIEMSRGDGFAAQLAQWRRLWRKYDLALSPLPTDRARMACRIAGRRCAGVIEHRMQDRFKAALLDRWTYFDDLDTHTVVMGLRMADLLGIAPVAEVVPPSASWPSAAAKLGALSTGRRYAVLHPCPKFNYKRWTPEGWSALARWLMARGLGVVLTGGPDAAEREYVDGIVRAIGDDGHHDSGVLNVAGRLSLGETAELIRRAALFVGPDTAVTHIAAATGAPTLALFGPSNPVKWGPWPVGGHDGASPWPRRGSGRQGNVYLLQGENARGCVPCLREGCERHIDSGSDCLQNLSVARVIAAAGALLKDVRCDSRPER